MPFAERVRLHRMMQNRASCRSGFSSLLSAEQGSALVMRRLPSTFVAADSDVCSNALLLPGARGFQAASMVRRQPNYERFAFSPLTC